MLHFIIFHNVFIYVKWPLKLVMTHDWEHYLPTTSLVDSNHRKVERIELSLTVYSPFPLTTICTILPLRTKSVMAILHNLYSRVPSSFNIFPSVDLNVRAVHVKSFFQASELPTTLEDVTSQVCCLYFSSLSLVIGVYLISRGDLSQCERN